MGVSTDAQISFGVMFPEGYEFPWEKDEYDWDINTWWKILKKRVDVQLNLLIIVLVSILCIY